MKNNENMIQIDFENQKNTKKEYVKGTGIGIQNIKKYDGADERRI